MKPCSSRIESAIVARPPLRGAGDLAGAKQWGISDLGMEAIKNIKMVEAAREEAKRIIEKNLLKNYATLQKEFETRDRKIHFE